MRVLVLGCGSIGARHARNLASLRVELLLADVDRERVEALASACGGRAVADLDAGLGESPDAVAVCTPTHLHGEPARRALAAGAHVFVEKPIAVTLDEARALGEAAAAAGRTLLVGCNLRFHEPVRRLHAWTRDGRIGAPRLARMAFGNLLSRWRPGRDWRATYSARAAEGGGMLLEGVHEIDYARWIFGEVEQVQAETANLGVLGIDVEELAEVGLRFASGAHAQIHLDSLCPVRTRSCEIVGSKGYAVWRALGKQPERSVLECWDADGVLQDREELALDLGAMYLDEMRHFLACVRGEAAPLLDGPGATRVLEIALAARDAAREGARRKLDPPGA